MTKLILPLTVAAFVLLPALQAGDCSSSCCSATKTSAKQMTSTKTTKSSACCSATQAKRTAKRQIKGAEMLVASSAR